MQSLSEYAVRIELKKTWQTWVLLRAMIGQPIREPRHQGWARVSLGTKIELAHRRRAFWFEMQQVLSSIFGPTHGYTEEKANSIFSETAMRFIAHIESRSKTPFSLGRVHVFERTYRTLHLSEHDFDSPPYGEILLQGFTGFTIRYPEYHLAADICHFHRLLKDEFLRIEADESRRLATNSEAAQAIARSTIIAVYNLLESVANGLAVAWLLQNPEKTNPAMDCLAGPAVPLWRRFTNMPEAVTGKRLKLNTHEDPLSSLFWRLKRRRDYIVHCVPDADPDGATDTQAREELFHDIPLADVEETMECAFAAIRLIWPHVSGRTIPSWLPSRSDPGYFTMKCFTRNSVALCEKESKPQPSDSRGASRQSA